MRPINSSEIPRLAERSLPAAVFKSIARREGQVFLRFLSPGVPAPRSVTFGEFGRSIRSAIGWLRGKGFGAGDRLVLLAENSPEWQIFAFAAQVLRGEPVALFANLGAVPAQAAALASAPRVLFVSGQGQWDKVAPCLGELQAKGLREIVSVGPLSIAAGAGSLQAATSAAEALQTPPIDDADLGALIESVGPGDPFLMLFTSGTVRPKGVRVPQRAIVTTVENGRFASGLDERDEGLQFLPFGHIAGQCQFAVALVVGHPLILVASRDDISRGFALGPTNAFSVPLIYERIRAGVEAQIAERPLPVRKALQAALDAAARVRCQGSRAPVDRLLAAAADLLIGRKVKARLGGRLRKMFAGGAATPPALHRFFESLGLPYVNFYGLSETAGVISYTVHDRERPIGSAGAVTPDLELRIEPDGEICVRGPLVMTGYLDAADQAEAMTADGFFRTGDLGEVRSGELLITGRKKHLFVLSTGKKMSPEPVEQAIASTPPFLGAVLLGDGKPYLSAAVFIAADELARRRANGADADKDLLELARSQLAAFSDYEKPKKLLLVPGAPTDEPSILTPSFKLKREAFGKWKAAEIEALYAAPKG